MDSNNTNSKKPLIREEELTELIRKVVHGKKTVLLWTLCFFVLGILVAFTTKKTYTSQVVMAPESGETSALGGLGSIAAMAGINVDALGGGSDAIYPLLYPDIVGSLPFVTSLLDTKIQTVDGTLDTTYLYYRQTVHKQGLMEKIVHFPKKTVKKFLKLFVKGAQWTGDANVFDPYWLSEGQMNFIDNLKHDFSVKIDKKTDVITLSFTEQDPKVAAIMADALRLSLQNAITEYRTGKAVQDYNYIEGLYNESKSEYLDAQLKFADFCDKNRNISLEKVQIEKNRLESDMDLKNQLFSQWAQQLELSRAKIQQNTPAFTIMSPAAIPALPSSPRKLKTMCLFILLGLVLGCCYVAFKDPVKSAFRKISTHDI